MLRFKGVQSMFHSVDAIYTPGTVSQAGDRLVLVWSTKESSVIMIYTAGLKSPDLSQKP